ncbi:MAG: hypothetical protein O2856_13440 [Planctomycetota bacterium]|nr:hypothetical protein [Planctomycetota bacterium]
MLNISGITAVAAAIGAVWMAVRIRSMLAAWTVHQAWTWMIAALFALLFHTIVGLPQLRSSVAVTSATAYFSATMLLAPLVTILGARRPGISAWHWFVVLPMVVVMQWPAMSQLLGSHWRAPIELNAPVIMGIAVVLVMSAGTLLATRSATFALLYSAGIVVLLISATSATWGKTPATPFAAILILISMWIVRRSLCRQLQSVHNAASTALKAQAVQELFSNFYGYSWTRRVQDRINQFAPREHWTVRLEASGFLRVLNNSGDSPTDAELQKPIEAFIWVMARFGDEIELRQWLTRPQNVAPPCDATHLQNPTNRNDQSIPPR